MRRDSEEDLVKLDQAATYWEMELGSRSAEDIAVEEPEGVRKMGHLEGLFRQIQTLALN